MSANNQILVQRYKSKWYVFDDVIAESWSENNELNVAGADGIFSTKENALIFANALEEGKLYPDIIEYGVVIGKLIKDDAKVLLEEEERGLND